MSKSLEAEHEPGRVSDLVDELCINTIRMLSIDAVQKANSGHLTTDGIHSRVVSMPSWELFERQSQSYREAVLPPSVRVRVAMPHLCASPCHLYVPAGSDR